MSFSNGDSARVEVDTGSSAMILDEKYMKSFAISPDDKNVKTVKGKDETGHPYVRYFASSPATHSLQQLTNTNRRIRLCNFNKSYTKGS